MLRIKRYLHHQGILLQQFRGLYVPRRLHKSRLECTRMLSRMHRRTYGTKVSCLICSVANVSEAHTDTFVNIYPCPSVNGTFTDVFCCKNQLDITCCDKPLYWSGFGEGAEVFLPHGDKSPSASTTLLSQEGGNSSTSSQPLSSNVNTISNSISSLRSTTTALSANGSLGLATSSCASPPRSNDYVALGAEIGVPLGVLLLLALSFLLLMEHRRRKSSEKTLNWIHVRDKSKEKAKARGRRNLRMNNHTTVFELGDSEQNPMELHGGGIYEAIRHSPSAGHDRSVAL